MKHIIFTLLISLIIFTGCSSSDSSASSAKLEKNTSLNGFVQYKLPDDWQEISDYIGVTEVAIEKEDKGIGILMDYIEYDLDKPASFIKYQESILDKMGAEMLKERNENKDKRIINTKVYKGNKDQENVRYIIGTIEFEGNKDVYLGIMATIIYNAYGDTSKEDVIFEILNTVKLTDKNLNEEKHYISEKEYTEVTLPKKWRRLERFAENNFYKINNDGVLYCYISTFSSEETDPQKEFNNFVENFEKGAAESKPTVIDENIQDLGDKKITSKAYKFIVDELEVFSYFNLVEFKDSNLFVTANYNIDAEGGFDFVKEELDSITKSIKIKDGAEEKYRADLEAFKEAIEKQSAEISSMEEESAKEEAAKAESGQETTNSEKVSEEASEKTTQKTDEKNKTEETTKKDDTKANEKETTK